MTVFESDISGQPPLVTGLISDLGDSNWRTRQVAVDGLLEDDSDSVVSLLVKTICDKHRDLSRLNATIQVLARTKREVIPALLPLLAHADPETRAYTALALGLRGDPRAIPDLVAALSDPDRNVQVQTIESLGKLQAAAAVDTLIQFVESTEFEVAFPALDALTAIGDERVAYRLIPLLSNPLLDVAVVEALGCLGNQDAIVPLCSLVGNSAISIGTISRATQKIHDRFVTRNYDDLAVVDLVRQTLISKVAALHAATTGLSRTESAAIVSIISWLPGKAADTALLDLLHSPETCEACRDAIPLRGKGIVPDLIERLDRATPETKPYFIELCTRIADPRFVSWLLTCLESDDEKVIEKSLDALARIGDPGTYEIAKSFLGHDSSRIRHSAINALNTFGHPDMAEDMERSLKESSPLVRESALKIAAYFGFPQCLDAIFACCEGEDEQIRRTAIEHLPCLDDNRVIVQLQKGIHSESAVIRKAVAGALGEIDSHIAIPLLSQVLNDTDVWVRYIAIRSLAGFGYGSVTKKNLEFMAFNDPAIQVRIAAVEAMSLGSTSALIELAKSAHDDLAIASISALGRTGDPAGLPTLLAAIQSDDRAKKQAAISALGNLGLIAIEPLRDVALGRDHTFAEEAIKALGRIPLEESTTVLLIAAETPAKRPASIAALLAQGDAVIPFLARHLVHLTLDVRLAVIQVLSLNRSHTALDLLDVALTDDAPAVRYAALAALANISPVGRQTPQAFGNESNA